MTDVEEMLARLERIQFLTAKLAKAHGDAISALELSESIRREIESLKAAIKPYPLVH